MGRPPVEINPNRGLRLKELISREGVTQKDFAKSIFLSPQTVSKIIHGTASLTPETAQRISETYPGYSAGWLLCYTDYADEWEHFNEALAESQREGDALMTGLLSFARLSGFEVKFASPSHRPDEDGAPVEKWLAMFRDGYTITRGNEKAHISLEDMNRLQNEIADFVEFKLGKFVTANQGGVKHG